MNYAAFFRNLNLGRSNSPTKLQLEQAFLEAGATDAQSFLTNGTIAFAINHKASPSKILSKASEHLKVVCGLKEPGFIRSIEYLRKLVELDPFADVDKESVDSCCVTFLHASVPPPPPVPFSSRRGDVEVISFYSGEAMSISRKILRSAGSPNAFLEKHFALPATTRNWNTIVRLVNKHA